MIILRNETVSNRRIDLRVPDEAAHIIVDSTLHDCEVLIPGGNRAFRLITSTFERCTFRTRKLTNFKWVSNAFRSCTFEGKFSNNDFGSLDLPHLTGSAPLPRGMTDCDFARALMHQCRFFDSDEEIVDHTFAPFPTIVVMHPVQNEARLRQLLAVANDSARNYFLEMASKVTALVLDLEVVSEKSGVELEVLRAALGAAPEIVLCADGQGKLSRPVPG